MSPNNADGMANSVDPDQTAPLGAVWSGSALFAQAYLSENLGSLRYPTIWTVWFYYKIMCSKDAKRMASSIDPDQIAPSLFAQACLSEYKGVLAMQL